MSLVRYYAAATLDGYIAAADDSIEWLTGYEGSFEGADSDASQAGYEAFYEGIGALVMGSVTYEWVLAHGGGWPYAGKPAWVLSSRELARPEGEGVDVRIAEANVTDLVDEMLAAAGDRDLWIVGGGKVASQFADHDLLDRVEVTVVPVVLGAGKPLFERPLSGGHAAGRCAYVRERDGRPDLRGQGTRSERTCSGLSCSSESSTTAARSTASRSGGKSELGMAITVIPAESAERIPLVESSIAAQTSGSTSSRLAASR